VTGCRALNGARRWDYRSSQLQQRRYGTRSATWDGSRTMRGRRDSFRWALSSATPKAELSR
jgi:hypothetical protein